MLIFMVVVQVISKDEFYGGCSILNEHLPEGQKLTDIEHILQVLDFDGSGQIELNEFFEAFRILDAKGMNVLNKS
jgi:Ca2+-binding EF-hand superfamily protein